MYRFMEPLVFGNYPFIMKALIRDELPEFIEAENDLVRGSFHFMGDNYYTSRYALSSPFINMTPILVMINFSMLICSTQR